MQTIQNGYRGLSLLFTINYDRLLYVFAIIAALYLGSVIGTFVPAAVAH